MQLAVDASTLVGEALRSRGCELLAHPVLQLVVAAAAWSETEHELRKRMALLVQYGHLTPTNAEVVLDDALAVITALVTVAPEAVYAAQMEEARRRVPRDRADAPTVAVALTFGCAILTADRDFFGCGLPVWTVDSLLRHLQAKEGTAE